MKDHSRQTDFGKGFFMTIHGRDRSVLSMTEGISVLGDVANLVMGFVTKNRIDQLHARLVSTEATASQAYHMSEVSLSLLDSVLGEVEKLESAQKRMEDSLKVLNIALGTLTKAVG